MVSDKKRLHVAIYPSGVSNSDERKYVNPVNHVYKSKLTVPHRYHWAFLVGPKLEKQQEVPGMKYHVKNHPTAGWTFEETPVDDVGVATNLLARLTIAKIKDEKRLVEILRGTTVVQDDPEWRCRTWVSEVLTRLAEDGTVVGTGWLEWDDIEALARQYVMKKSAAGRYAEMKELAPTWSLVDGKETVA